MKSIISLLFFIVCLTTSTLGQYKELHYLRIENNKVLFQKVYDHPGDAKTGILKLLKSGPFSDVDTTSALLSDFHVNIKKYKTGAMPIYMKGAFFGNVRVDFKEDKYRVTVTNIQNYTAMELTIGGVSTTASKEAIETFAIKSDGTFKTNQENSMITLSRALSDLFVLPDEDEATTDNW